jgi:hypothetical protein
MAKKKVKKDKQRSTKHTYQTKDRVTGIPLKPGVNPGGTRRVNLVSNLMILTVMQFIGISS